MNQPSWIRYAYSYRKINWNRNKQNKKKYIVVKI